MDQNTFQNRIVSIVGQPYSKYDCIGVVRYGANISCQGTNWLWRSINNASKYRYLIERHEGQIDYDQRQIGVLVFRINWNVIPKGYDTRPDCHHVGVLIYDNGWYVIQSNPGTGVTFSPFVPGDWDAWGKLKQIEYKGQMSETPEEPDPFIDYLPEIYKMVKTLYDAYLFALKNSGD